MTQRAEYQSLPANHVEDRSSPAREQGEQPGPSFREVAVPVPQFREMQREGRKITQYVGDSYVRGYELRSGVIDEQTLRTDQRFANDPRIILYADTGTHIWRFDVNTRQIQAATNNSDSVRESEGRYASGSLRLRTGGSIVSESFHIEEYALYQDIPPDYIPSNSNAMNVAIDNILIRTSQPLNEQQVTQFRQSGLINRTARDFAYPQARYEPLPVAP